MEGDVGKDGGSFLEAVFDEKFLVGPVPVTTRLVEAD